MYKIFPLLKPTSELMPQTTLKDVLALTQQRSPLDKVHLVERVSAQLEKDLTEVQLPDRRSLRGLWQGVSIQGVSIQGVNITEQNIAETRQAMWQNFPRETLFVDKCGHAYPCFDLVFVGKLSSGLWSQSDF